MATYGLSLLRMDGERILFDEGRLSADGGHGARTWDVRLDGAHILRWNEQRRVRLQMGTAEGKLFEGDAQVGFAGHRDEDAEVYHGVELTGIGELRELPEEVAVARPHAGNVYQPKT